MCAYALPVQVEHSVDFPALARQEALAEFNCTGFGDFVAVEYPAEHSPDVGIGFELSGTDNLACVDESANDHP